MRVLALSVASLPLLCLLSGCQSRGPDVSGRIFTVIPPNDNRDYAQGSLLIGTKRYPEYRMSVRKTTLIQQSSGIFPHPIRFSDLRVGQTVQVETTGTLLESFPAQAIAARILVVQNATPAPR